MKRRGFFGTLAGLCLGALGVKAKPTPAGLYVMGVDPATDCQSETVGVGFDLSIEKSRQMGLSAGTVEFITQSEIERLERERWGPLPKLPYGIKYWLVK